MTRVVAPTSMPIAFIAVVAALLYLAAAGLQLTHMAQRRQRLSRAVMVMALAALVGHAIVTWDALNTGQGVSFGFYRALSLSFLAVNIACVAALLKRPLQNLLIGLFPLSALAIVVATLGPETSHARSELSPGILLHIGSSILAYSILTLAAAQAALVALQDRQLRQRNMHGIARSLPPLQLMERMLFELIWIGVIALTVAIASGMIFMENMFAQHLVHKTILSMVAWVVFSVLLWGRYQLGWRAQTAVRFTLSGFALLILAFFGSKLVLELILKVE
ncbi:cytochrome c biogenesis protein CcsA [Pseudohaliea sp.]|uniref:cytochrome C assembly family protein n=1 Tax=Pseudohaliea sp. TaxID=2740289 RepID=UPI0032EB0AC5